MSRVQCRCGRRYYSGSGLGVCPRCARADELAERREAQYSEIEMLEVLSRARRAEMAGLMPTWRVTDGPQGIRYQIGRGKYLSLEEFDFRVAAHIRRARRKLGYKR